MKLNHNTRVAKLNHLPYAFRRRKPTNPTDASVRSTVCQATSKNNIGSTAAGERLGSFAAVSVCQMLIAPPTSEDRTNTASMICTIHIVRGRRFIVHSGTPCGEALTLKHPCTFQSNLSATRL